MNKLIMILIVAIATIVSVSAENLTFETVTDAMNYTGNTADVTSVTVTGTVTGIPGSQYSNDSEWSKFYRLNEVFTNIESVEILTDQDIPEWEYHPTGYRSFFHIDAPCTWLKNFSAPNVKRIGFAAFYFNAELVSANFPNVTTMLNSAFMGCSKLLTISLPKVTYLGYAAFWECSSLKSISFGTDFEEQTVIKFEGDIFDPTLTKNIDLVLGCNVLPEADLDANTWQETIGDGKGIPYVWKTIYNGIKEIVKNNSINIFPNPATESTTISLELETTCNIKITLTNISGQELMDIYDGFVDVGLFRKSINTKNLAKGVYLLKISIGGGYITEKLVITT